MSIPADSNFFSTFESKGRWWLPQDTKNVLRGELKYNPEKGAHLELDGSFFSLSDTLNGRYEQPSVIVGQADSGEVVTLLKNFVLGAHGGLTNPCLSIQAGVVLSNFYYTKEDDLSFWASGVHFDGIENWFAQEPFTTAHSDDRKSSTIKFNRPGDLSFDLTEIGFDVKAISSVSGFSVPAYEKAGFRMARYLQVEASKGETFWWHLERLTELNRFFTVLYGEDCLDKKMYLFGFDNGKRVRTHKTRVEVFIKPTQSVPAKKWHPHDFLFCYPHVRADFHSLLKNWFKLLSEASAPIALFASTLRKRKQFSQLDFLAAAQSLESLHRSLHGGVKLDEDGYQKCLDAMMASIPVETEEPIKAEIMRMLTTGNEWSLRKRLKFYFSQFESIGKKLVADKNQFIHKVIEARNYYTHYDLKNKGKIIEGAELYYLSEKLKILVLAQILDKLGIKVDLIEARLSEHSRWGYMMRKGAKNK